MSAPGKADRLEGKAFEIVGETVREFRGFGLSLCGAEAAEPLCALEGENGESYCV